jgi:nicotinamide mononucleotide transporter
MPAELLEASGAVVGAVAVWLMVRENAWGWPIGLINLGAYVVVFARERLYGAMGLQVVYIALSLYGWHQWRQGTSAQSLRVSKAPHRVLTGLLGMGAVLALVFGTALSHLTDAAAPWVDAPLTAASLVAQALQTRKWIENWTVWIVANAGYVALYSWKGMWPTAALYVAFLLLAILGLREWRRTLATAARRRRIVLTGSECTGKTTLAAFLSHSLGAALSEEYSRGYASKHCGPLGPEDVEPIARGQIALLDQTSTSTSPLVIHDTDLVSTVVYARHYYGDCPQWIVDEARSRLADLYLLCHPDIPWQGDGVRDRPQARDDIHTAFVDTLHSLGATLVHIQGDFTRREHSATVAVDRLVQAAGAQDGSRGLRAQGLG